MTAGEELRVLTRAKELECVLDRFGEVSEIEATIANYELAFRMQSEVPELVDLKSESETTRKLYGLEDPV